MRGPEGMKCHCCGGPMVHERFYGDEEHFWGWRCIICGEIADEVILENRRWVSTRAVADNKKEALQREG